MYLHLRLQAELVRKEKIRRSRMSKIVNNAEFWESSSVVSFREDSKDAGQDKPATVKYFFDLNVLEAALLGCLIVICVCGIMFESGRLQTRQDLAWQVRSLV
jgi:hypothetical protein